MLECCCLSAAQQVKALVRAKNLLEKTIFKEIDIELRRLGAVEAFFLDEIAIHGPAEIQVSTTLMRLVSYYDEHCHEAGFHGMWTKKKGWK